MSARANRTDVSRYVLITQCLQNDLFLNDGCRLKLPETIVPQMLVGNRNFDLRAGGNGPDTNRADAIRNGPLGTFLAATVGRAFDSNFTLHVINIRDWHVPGETYDAERRAYGAHCERGTWGVGYLEGLERWLDPTGTSDADYAERGGARIYHLRSDSVFDFKPRIENRGGMRKFRASELEDILDVLVQGSDQHLEEIRTLLTEGAHSAIHKLAREIDSRGKPQTEASVYMAVIGVYTDIKVQTLLVGLRTRYDLPNLGVSDTFTASTTLERHLAALDYAVRVLDVEVVHGVNDLVSFLGLPPPLEAESQVVARMSYARYRSFFQDKQNVLAFQDEKLRQYVALTERRSLEVYERIKRANTFLIWFGCTFLGATLVFATLNVIWPDTFGGWQIVAITGGVGLLQLVSAFISKPIRDLQQNLTNLAVFKMILESHSLKTALARFHLTTPHTLRDLETEGEKGLAAAQVEVLRQQVLAIQEFDSADFGDLARLARAFGEDGAADRAPIESAVPKSLVETQADSGTH
jgi:nicotinamidase-related amidase